MRTRPRRVGDDGAPPSAAGARASRRLTLLLAAGLAAGCAGANALEKGRSAAGEGTVWHLRVGRLGSTDTVLDERFHGETARLRLPRGRYWTVGELPCDSNCSHLDRETDRCGSEIFARGGRLNATVHAAPERGCEIAVDNTPGSNRATVAGVAGAPRWLLAQAWREAAALQDPHPISIRLRVGAYDTILIRGTFTCAYCPVSPGAPAPVGTHARLTIDPRTRIADGFSLN